MATKKDVLEPYSSILEAPSHDFGGFGAYFCRELLHNPLDSEDHPIPNIRLWKFKSSSRSMDISIVNIIELILHFNESMLAMSVTLVKIQSEFNIIGCTPLDSTGLHTRSL